MTAAAGGIWLYLFIIVAGFLATDIWRFLGVATAARLAETSEILRWVRAVATALIAGLVARLILFPIGELATAGLPVRLGAVAIGLAAFVALRRNVLAGILAGEAALLAGMWLNAG